MKMSIPIIQVDAFTDRPFAGNPAAVCLLDAPPDESPDESPAGSWMQLVAREMNLSETAFLVPRGEDFDLRWFTPTVEVDLCGHATLASAHVLWEEGYLPPDQPIRFHTRSGVLVAEKLITEKKAVWIEMDFPATPAEPLVRVEGLESALGAKAISLGRPRFDYLVELASEEEVRALKPDLSALRQLKVRGVIVTARASGPEYDFVSRVFAPAVGVDEDPVTGSAHCCLGPFWKERLGHDNLVGYQASARGGIVRTRCVGDRVFLSGQAVTVLRGHLL
jgi:PhzF family phenazine biosynthesis protein